jgi:hypothetical protein
MTALAKTLEALRESITADSPDTPADFDAVPGRGALAALHVTRDQAGRASLVVLTPARPAALAGLSAAFGAATQLPRRPSGGAPTVLFRATLPADGERGVTVLAELDERGRAARVLLRRDEFS